MKGFGAQWKHLICFKYVCHFSWSWLMFSWERFVIQVRCWPEGKIKNLRSVGVGEEGRENRKFQARSCFIGKINPAGQQSQSACSPHPGQKCPSPVCMTRRLGWLELGATCLHSLRFPSAGWGLVTMIDRFYTASLFPERRWEWSEGGISGCKRSKAIHGQVAFGAPVWKALTVACVLSRFWTPHSFFSNVLWSIWPLKQLCKFMNVSFYFTNRAAETQR